MNYGVLNEDLNELMELLNSLKSIEGFNLKSLNVRLSNIDIELEIEAEQ
jgi:hypothetical protein